jgi:hypothetical protein
MGEKKRVQRALVEGATRGLRSGKLFDFVRVAEPEASRKKIAHLAFLTLTDPDLKDQTVLDAIYGLAIGYRLGEDDQPIPTKAKVAHRPRSNRAPRERSAATNREPARAGAISRTRADPIPE